MPNWSWRIAEPVADGVAPDLEAWPPPLPQLLFNRGLRESCEVEQFLHPHMGGAHDPFLLLGMDLAVERVFRALRANEVIGIYGDFDVDGLTAVALLAEVLESPPFEGRVLSYLPHRTREGYGLNAEAVRGLARTGVQLLITVDCGVGGDDEIRIANDLGVDVIVTDHHRIPAGVPPALAVLNPRQEGCAYPFQELAGVGVAYKLAEALLARAWGSERARERLESQLDLVALGTVADLAPLVGENRLMVKLGLEQMNRRARPGLEALISVAGYSARSIDTERIAYGLAPRLNAAGRMGDARLSLDLLTGRSESEVARIASELEAANRERQATTAAAVGVARDELSRVIETPPAIVLAGDYPSGIVGLVASRLADEFHRPAFVIELGEVESRGSGRGVPGFDLVHALSEASDLLVRFGGHAQAAGFVVETSRFRALRARLETAAMKQMAELPTQRELYLEAGLSLGEIGHALHQRLALLEPCGAGNPRPLFYSQRVLVRDSRVVGKGHLKLWLADETGTSPAIAFGMGTEEYSFARPGTFVDCAYSIGRNERGGTVGYEMVLKDLRPWRLKA